MRKAGELLAPHLAALGIILGMAAVAHAQKTNNPPAATYGEKLASALPAPLEGFSARERVEDNIETGQVRVQRVYLDTDNKPVIMIMVRSETPATLKNRKDTFMDAKVVKEKNGEFKNINGQKFSILKVKGEYTAMTIVEDTYSVLYFGAIDRTMLLAHIVSTDFARIAAAK
ncbi:MAG: hypothetical protein OXD42_14500 [Rhodospirillaceae bacterium]|nr:hypothetical protein [Rhodospirillaceae bacterium]MCY4238058.1 hypothetical protein [Rhodospirillaceae bacterium]